MAMAYGLVKQHRGYLHLYSEVGQGTTAKAYFPAVRDRGISEFEAAADEGLPGGTETILLVEDDRSEEHTSELQSQSNLVCRLLLEKKQKRRSPFVSTGVLLLCRSRVKL